MNKNIKGLAVFTLGMIAGVITGLPPFLIQ